MSSIPVPHKDPCASGVHPTYSASAPHCDPCVPGRLHPPPSAPAPPCVPGRLHPPTLSTCPSLCPGEASSHTLSPSVPWARLRGPTRSQPRLPRPGPGPTRQIPRSPASVRSAASSPAPPLPPHAASSRRSFLPLRRACERGRRLGSALRHEPGAGER